MPHVHRSGRIGGHIFHIDLPARADPRIPIRPTGFQDVPQPVAPESVRKRHVDKARSRDIDPRDGLSQFQPLYQFPGQVAFAPAALLKPWRRWWRRRRAASLGGPTTTRVLSRSSGHRRRRPRRLWRSPRPLSFDRRGSAGTMAFDFGSGGVRRSAPERQTRCDVHPRRDGRSCPPRNPRPPGP